MNTVYSKQPNPRILLVRPEYSARLAKRSWLMTEPLDLEYLAAIVNEADCEYAIHDPMVTGRSFNSMLDEFSPDIIAITGYYPAKDQMLGYAHQAKSNDPQVLTIIGGVHAELNYTDFYHDAVDVVVHSGGALTFRSLLSAVQNATPLSDINGVCLRSEGADWTRKEAAPFKPADLPRPDRSHFNTHREQFTYLHYGPVALLKTAYGCPFDCRFCYCRMLNDGRHSERALDDIVSEIQGIESDRIWIVDDTFLLDMDRVHSFASRLKEMEVHKEFIIYSRAEFIANNPAVIPLLKEIGVINVIIGFESINEEKLNEYSKRVAEEESRKCIRLLQEGAIECTGLFIMDLDATRADFQSLDRWIKETKLTTYTLSIFTPYPGTKPFEQYRDQLVTTDCRKWDFLHLVMAPTKMTRASFYMHIFGMHLKMLVRNRALRKYAISRLRLPNRKKSNIWDFWADRYESLWVQKFSLGPTRQEILKNIPIQSGTTILDMGCGTGQLFGDLCSRFGSTPFSYTGVDQSAQMIRVAQKKHPNGTFSVASSEEYREPDSKYDVIVCAHSFPYFPDKQATIMRLKEMLNEGGALIIAQASVNNPYDALMLALVKLTTTKAHYPSRKAMRALTQPAFSSAPDETRISPNLLIPSIYLFRWTRNKVVSS